MGDFAPIVTALPPHRELPDQAAVVCSASSGARRSDGQARGALPSKRVRNRPAPDGPVLRRERLDVSSAASSFASIKPKSRRRMVAGRFLPLSAYGDAD